MESIDDRRAHLMNLLTKKGLDFDTDSELCLQYIYLGNDALYSPDKIVSLIGQNRFLNEFCDHAAGLRLARNQCASVKLPRDQWLQRVRRCVLKSSGYDDFPSVWPWHCVEGATRKELIVDKSCGELVKRCYFDGVQGPRSSDCRVETQSNRDPRSPRPGKRFKHFSKLSNGTLLRSWRR